MTIQLDFPGVVVVGRSLMRSKGVTRFLVLFAALAWCVPLWAAQPVSGVRFAHLDSDCNDRAPVTFAQTFRDGDVPAGRSMSVQSKQGGLPTQVDVKARNPDGSVRHAVLSLAVPCSIERDDSLRIVTTSDQNNASSGPAAPDSLLKSDFDTTIRFNDHGHEWHLNARDLLERVGRAGGCDQAGIYCRRWLRGTIANEWVVGAPPVDGQGKAHPHLMVFFAVRAYGPAPIRTVRVDTAVENDWAYAPNPTNETYSATLSVPGQKPRHIDKLTHYRQARWHQVLWWGDQTGPAWFAALNGRYLQATPAVPSYQSIRLDPGMLSKVRQSCQPMSHCDVMAYMGSTGAQPQIGPLPQWSAAYIVNPNDYRTYRWMLADSDALGAYGVHFREQGRDQALSVLQHPCATTLAAGEISTCPVPPKADDRLPHCKHDCHTPLHAETAHHGAPAYVAYLVTGDWYYEQELNFWADWLLLLQNPAYRGFTKGLVSKQQVRAQAWGLRTLGDAAYLLPDDAPLKRYFNRVVANNIAWYNARYANNPKANRLGLNNSGLSIVYPRSGPHARTSMSPWQLSFFTWATGNLADLGFDGAERMRDYFARFQLGTLNASGFCPELATNYTLRVRDTASSDFYSDFATVYRKTFPSYADIGCDSRRLNKALKGDKAQNASNFPTGTMVGYPASDTGFVANFQIGLASAVASAGAKGRSTWAWFMDRPVRPDYRQAPQFGVVPTRITDGP